MKQSFVIFSMNTCNKSLALSFCLLVLLCLSICPVASAFTTNAFGYLQFSYEELDEWWEERYEDITGEHNWPGLSEWINTRPDVLSCFRRPHPHVIGRLDTQNVTFSATNGFVFPSLGPHRNYLCDLQGTLTPIDEEVPTFSMLQIADNYNLVDTAVESLANVPNMITNDAVFPWRLRLAQVIGMQSHILARASALLFQGVSLEVKSVPYPYAGYWYGWAISVCGLIENGVNPSVLGSFGDMCDEQNVAWITDTRSIFGAFSNITLRVQHRWETPSNGNE